MIQSLPERPLSGSVPAPVGTESHPMRLMTRRIAGLEPGPWDSAAFEEVMRTFDALAPEWHTRVTSGRLEIVEDVFARGLDQSDIIRGIALEVGAGIGSYTHIIEQYYDSVLSVDLSFEMISQSQASTAVVADGSILPVTTDSVDAVVLINAFLFPDEVDRILKEGGLVIWVNSSGPSTLIHLSTEDVVKSLAFDVTGVDSRTGTGTWCVLRKSGVSS